MVRRNVVRPRDEQRECDELEPREEIDDRSANRGAPPFALRRRVPLRREVARQQAPVGELFRGEVPVRGDDQRLEQPLRDRVPIEQVPGLGRDGELRPKRADELGRLGPRGEHDGACLGGAAVAEPESPRRADWLERRYLAALYRRPGTDGRLGERLHDRLRPIEVAVLAAP